MAPNRALILLLTTLVVSCVEDPPPDPGPADAGPQDAGPEGLVWDGECPAECFALSLDPDIPLAIDGAFTAEGDMWLRPHDDEELCPASTTLDEARHGAVPYVAFAFCNTDSQPHTFNFEFLAQAGPQGEPPLADPFLILYEGECVPTDPRACVAMNDDLGPLTNDAEIFGVTLPAGAAITVVGTTFQVDEGAGFGGYLMVVGAAD